MWPDQPLTIAVPVDPELDVIAKIITLVEKLQYAERARVLNYIAARLA